MNRLVKEFDVPEAAHKDGEYVYDPGLSLKPNPNWIGKTHEIN